MEKTKATALKKKRADLENDERNRGRSANNPLGDYDDF